MFSEVYDNEWSDAFENISKMEDDKKVGVLHGIVMNAFSYCKEKIEEQNQAIENILTKNIEEQTVTTMHMQITKSLDRLRIQLSTEMAGEVAKDFTARSLQGLLVMSGIKLGGKDTAVRQYALKCAEMCWLLLVHIPELSISDDEVGVPFDQNIYKSYTRRLSDLRQPTIGICVWPAIFQGSNVLVKGVAEPMETKRKPLYLQR